MSLLPAADYPWSEPARTGLLTEAGLLEGDAPIAMPHRTPVAAVGSNASPNVLRHKLGDFLATGLPLAVGEVEQLAVGHSAHVSARGYVAAAPFRGGGSHPVTIAWFDAAQLAVMDATEPNYRRFPLADRMPCRHGGVPLAGVEVYESVHGVIGESGIPLALRDQAGVLGWLEQRLPAAVGKVLDHEALSEATHREHVRAALVEADLVLPSGL